MCIPEVLPAYSAFERRFELRTVVKMAGGNRGKKTARGARAVASGSQRQPQDIYASALDAFVTVFLDDCTFTERLVSSSR